MLWLPKIAHADIDSLVEAINTEIINPVIYFLIVAGVAYFLYGVAVYVMNAGNAEARKKGTQHMIWGLIGIAIMVSVFGIMNLIMTTIGAK